MPLPHEHLAGVHSLVPCQRICLCPASVLHKPSDLHHKSGGCWIRSPLLLLQQALVTCSTPVLSLPGCLTLPGLPV